MSAVEQTQPAPAASEIALKDAPPRVYAGTPTAFLCLLSEVVRVPTHTLCVALMYIDDYRVFVAAECVAEPAWTEPIPDTYSLAIAALSLACKATESPRRLRELLTPAYHLFHRGTVPRLTFPSHLYDALRTGAVHCELVLLRVLGFSLTARTAFSSGGAVLERALVRGIAHGFHGIGDLEEVTLNSFCDAEGTVLVRAKKEREFMAEWGAARLIDTTVGRAAEMWAARYYRSLDTLGRHEPCVVAVAAVYMAITDEGYEHALNLSEWVKTMDIAKIDPHLHDSEEDLVVATTDLIVKFTDMR
ncbi:uncharacterized protein V1518DRAFT_444775 [Limtongia smithiae]|uniref:uncharacterized protein n=1 Tax=Limtongia smithiae TaxID=1125753 RepID=UPI0034CFFC11